MFSQREFDTAFAKARSNHPTISHALGESVMKKFVERWENNWPKSDYRHQPFRELIRLTLNELKVSGKAVRQMYSALIGFYYSQHAAYVNRRKASAKPVYAKPVRKAPAFVRVITNKSGQLGWEI